MREAMYYEKKEDNTVACLLCPHLCKIREGKSGICGVRQNKEGILFAINYGKVTSYGLDPIEKKPLYHFYPGSLILSFGSAGCNLGCEFCQNWQIAHGAPQSTDFSPERVVEQARQEALRGYSNIGIAYTYNEPFMWYEFVLDTARLAKKAGLKNVMVTNGFVREDPLREILPFIDAMNIDVKSFTDEFYRKTCKGRLAPVLRTVEIAHRECHVELTTLLVTGLNDSPEEIRRLVDWIASLDKEIPLHLSRYFPGYKLNLPATPLETLLQARDIAGEKLSYVYIGNAPQLDAGNTYCPACGATLINRTGYTTDTTGLKGKKCSKCGEKINI
ncbi:MAG: AmmeMemoRadiSam system radical SAM enzyme [Desulfotomaculaceae bacterium]|nr:AmmeMemoRadiSam system radical SAM enzyme [Desulfotomaculaceae bacterium]